MYLIDEMTHGNRSPLNHEKVQKSPPNFFELPDYPDVALPHTINVRNTSSLFILSLRQLVTPTRVAHTTSIQR